MNEFISWFVKVIWPTILNAIFVFDLRPTCCEEMLYLLRVSRFFFLLEMDRKVKLGVACLGRVKSIFSL